MMRPLLLAASLSLVPATLHGQDPAQPVAATTPIEFDVASFKPNSSGANSSSMRTMPNGQIVMTNTTVRTIIGRAYPSRGSTQMLGLPPWTESTHYDVIVKANRPVSRDEQQAMWRTLLADRMKLAAHYELRDEPTYDMVFARADHRLGTQMKASTCSPPTPQAGSAPARPPSGPPSGADVMARCSGFLSTGNTVFAPHTTAAGIAGFLRFGADRIVIDKTGLQGFFDVEFSYANRRVAAADAAANPADAPDFFTAVQEQLGFKLVPSTTPVEVVVIDRIERPTEN